MEETDLLIVGAGPAGLTAALYAARFNVRTRIVSIDVGGQANLARSVENYPGFEAISGVELMQRMRKQVEKYANVELRFEEVIEFKEIEGGYLVRTSKGEHKAKALVLAFGRTPRKLGCKGETEFLRKGVSYCAVCDMPFFAGKRVIVVGGGNSALDAALYGSELAEKVYLVHRREEFRAFDELVERVRSRANVELVLNSVVDEIIGENFVKAVRIRNVKTGEERLIECDGIFIEIGSEVKRELVEGFVKLNEKGEIVVDENCQTFYPDGTRVREGVYAAGDVTNVPIKQIVVACGMGAIAGINAAKYVISRTR